MVCDGFASDLTYRGFVEYETRQFLGSTRNSNQVRSNQALKFEAEIDWRLTDELSIGIQPFLRKELIDSERNAARFDQLWIKWALPSWELSIGNQVVGWGNMESLNRIDILNPRDYQEDPVDPRKVGVPMVTVQRLFDAGDISIFYLPYFGPSFFPGKSSIYEFTNGLDRQEPGHRFIDQWAVRGFVTWGELDVALSYFRGLERTPIFSLGAAGQSLDAETFLSDRVGIELTYVWSEVLLKGEAIFRHPHTPKLESSVLYTIGAETTWYSVLGHADVTGFLEYLGDSGGTNQVDFPSLQNDLFVGFRWTINDQYRQVLEQGILWDLEDRETYVFRVEYSANVWRNVTLNATYTNSFGGFFNPTVDDNDHGILKFSARYNF